MKNRSVRTGAAQRRTGSPAGRGLSDGAPVAHTGGAADGLSGEGLRTSCGRRRRALVAGVGVAAARRCTGVQFYEKYVAGRPVIAAIPAKSASRCMRYALWRRAIAEMRQSLILRIVRPARRAER